MKKLLLLFVATSVILLNSCKQEDVNALDNWENYQKIAGTPLAGTDLFLGRPRSIAYFDGHLGLYDFYDGKIFTWIRLHDKTSWHNTTFGNAPGEFTPPLYLFKDKAPEYIKIFERSKGIYHTYRLQDAIDGNLSASLHRDTIGISGSQAVPCGDYYVGNQMLDDKKMFYLFSPIEKTKIRFGDYPGNLKGIDDASVLDMMTQCQLCANNEGTVVVAAGYMTDMLSFYKIENSTAYLQKEYFTMDADVNIQKDAGGISLIPTSNTLQTYIHLCPTESFLYALYWGTKENERKEQSYIQVFDWDGNFVKGYHVEDRLISIAVNDDTKMMYGLTTKEDHPIIVYSTE